ncbi:MAG: type II toxin-antitoxin system mRNA interferase toxin, RelE/StbE family [Candidatus Taylorbacteria bacterium]|nr:type II toxin-antitoxin system mRNA interferase toxin, RelE/StbE family [Candidatus Taylorbacteria bacterium]
MLNIKYSHHFVRKVSKLEDSLVEEIQDKIELLKDENNHQKLKVHKLHGVLDGSMSFYVNYKIRVIFEYISNKEIVLEDVGGHDIY